MSTTDLIATAVILAPTALAAIPVLASQRASRADSARTRAVLDLSAHERAQAAEQDYTATPPDGGQPFPEPTPVVRLAPVIDLHTRRAA